MNNDTTALKLLIIKKTTHCLDISKRRYMFAKQTLKPKCDEDNDFRRDICLRSDGSYRLRSEPEQAEGCRFSGDSIEKCGSIG